MSSLTAQGRRLEWRKVEAEHFTVLSVLDEKSTANWASEFSLFVATVRKFITFDERRLPPITIVLFARDRDFNGYRMVDADGRPRSDVGGFFSRRETWAVAGLAGVSSKHVRRIIFHEGVHWLFSAYQRPNPVWVEEGIAELFSSFEFTRSKMSWGHWIDDNSFVLDREQFIPIERLMYMDRSVTYHGGGYSVGMVYAQSWLFAHYLLLGRHSLPEHSLDTYLKLYHSAIHPDEAFRRAFGRTYAEMQKELEAYSRVGTFGIFDVPRPESPPLTVVRPEPIEVEIGLARLALISQRLALAKEHAGKAVALVPEDPRGYEMLGIVLDESGERPAATHAYRSAMERGSRDFRSAFQLGVAIMEDAGDRQTPDDARAATRYFQISINLYPYQQQAYRNLARLSSRLSETTNQDRRFLELGLRLFPDDGTIALGLAVMLHGNGDRETALGVARRVFADESAYDRSTREWAGSLDERWTREAVMEKVEEARKGRRYAEAAGYFDELVNNGRLGSRRLDYVKMQREYLARDRFEQAVAANEAGDHDRAKALAEAVVADSAAPSATKDNARRFLIRLERRSAGSP